MTHQDVIPRGDICKATPAINAGKQHGGEGWDVT